MESPIEIEIPTNDKSEPVDSDDEKWTGLTSWSSDELKQIAKDIVGNLIFTDRHLREYERENIGMVLCQLSLGRLKDGSKIRLKKLV